MQTGYQTQKTGGNTKAHGGTGGGRKITLNFKKTKQRPLNIPKQTTELNKVFSQAWAPNEPWAYFHCIAQHQTRGNVPLLKGFSQYKCSTEMAEWMWSQQQGEKREKTCRVCKFPLRHLNKDIQLNTRCCCVVGISLVRERVYGNNVELTVDVNCVASERGVTLTLC